MYPLNFCCSCCLAVDTYTKVMYDTITRNIIYGLVVKYNNNNNKRRTNIYIYVTKRCPLSNVMQQKYNIQYLHFCFVCTRGRIDLRLHFTVCAQYFDVKLFLYVCICTCMKILMITLF